VYYTSGAATQYAAYVENKWLTGEEAATGRGTQVHRGHFSCRGLVLLAAL